MLIKQCSSIETNSFSIFLEVHSYFVFDHLFLMKTCDVVTRTINSVETVKKLGKNLYQFFSCRNDVSSSSTDLAACSAVNKYSNLERFLLAQLVCIFPFQLKCKDVKIRESNFQLQLACSLRGKQEK